MCCGNEMPSAAEQHLVLCIRRALALQAAVSGARLSVVPGQVVGPTIVGRSVAILGEARSGATKQWAAGCDLLIHPAISQV